MSAFQGCYTRCSKAVVSLAFVGKIGHELVQFLVANISSAIPYLLALSGKYIVFRGLPQFFRIWVNVFSVFNKASYWQYLSSFIADI
jgi:hypothetical protein